MGAESVVAICNRALSYAGISRNVASIEGTTVEERQCAINYAPARDGLLHEYPWRFATKSESLAELDKSHPRYRHVYAYPEDCIRLLGVYGPANRQSIEYEKYGDFVPFELVSVDGRRVILSDINGARAEYVSRAMDPLLFPPLFSEALAWRLASALIVPLSGGNMGDRDRLMQFYMRARMAAIEADANEVAIVMPQNFNSYVEARS